MDYRALVDKYGSKISKLIADQKFIDWLIVLLKGEGFGTAKQVIMADGKNTKAIKIAETEDDITYQINAEDSELPSVSYVINEGSIYEWGKVILPADITVDFDIIRKTYPLKAVTIVGLDEVDKNITVINSAGVNANLASNYTWAFSNIPSLTTLYAGDIQIGTITLEDLEGQVVVETIDILKQDRYIWGILNGTDTAPNIASALASVSGNIIPDDNDATFYQLTTGLGDIPSTYLIDTFGESRTFFFASVDSISFSMDNQIPLLTNDSSQSINLTTISGGEANLSRAYTVKTIDLNTVVTLTKS